MCFYIQNMQDANLFITVRYPMFGQYLQFTAKFVLFISLICLYRTLCVLYNVSSFLQPICSERLQLKQSNKKDLRDKSGGSALPLLQHDNENF